MHGGRNWRGPEAAPHRSAERPAGREGERHGEGQAEPDGARNPPKRPGRTVTDLPLHLPEQCLPPRPDLERSEQWFRFQANPERPSTRPHRALRPAAGPSPRRVQPRGGFRPARRHPAARGFRRTPHARVARPGRGGCPSDDARPATTPDFPRERGPGVHRQVSWKPLSPRVPVVLQMKTPGRGRRPGVYTRGTACGSTLATPVPTLPSV